MRDDGKTKEQLINELAELEESKTEWKQTEKELIETKDYLNNLTESSLDSIMFAERIGYITKVNKSFLELLGYREEEIVGKFVADLTPTNEDELYESVAGELVKIDKEFLNHTQTMIDVLRTKGKVSNWEAYYIRKDKKVVPIEQNIVCLYDKEGERTGAVSIIRDITDRRRAEKELERYRNNLENMVKERTDKLTKVNKQLQNEIADRKHAEEETIKEKDYLTNAIESSLDAIIITDNEGRIARVNQSFLKLIGGEKQEIIGKHMTEFNPIEEGTYESTTGKSVQIGKEFFDNAATFAARLLEGGKIENYESYMIRNDRKIVPVEDNITLLYNEKREQIGAIGVIRDITKRKLSENEIKEARDFLNSVFEGSRDGIVIVDENGYITSANSTMEKTTRFKKEELIGKHISTLTIEDRDSRKEILKKIEELYEKGFTSYEAMQKTKDGRMINTECNLSMIKDDKGNYIAGVSIIRDITERRKVEQETREARDSFENIFRTSVDGILVANAVGVITRVNRALETMLGYSSDELIGKYAGELAPSDLENYEHGIKYVTRLFEESAITGEKFNWLKKDGSIINVELNASLLKDKKGNLIGSLASIRDITERRKAEKELKTSEEKYHNLVEHANDAIISTNEEGIIIGFNRKAEEIFGYAENEILGKSVATITPSNGRKRQEEYIEERKKTHTVSDKIREGKGLRNNGQEFPVEVASSVIELHSEYIYTSIMRDLTERKEMEQKLIQSEKLKSLGELAGGVAHNFNNILAVILGRANLLQMNIDAPLGMEERRKSALALKKGLEAIEKASQEGAEVVRKIQEFTRHSHDDTHITPVNINKTIDDAIELTRIEWKDNAGSKGIKIEVKKDLSPIPSVAGNQLELKEVFGNLINNAIDAMPQGGDIKIRTFKQDNYVFVSIKDTGVGIPDGKEDSIFDPFFTTKGPQSRGLGLSASYGIINLHRGTISVDSIVGQGATFTIKLPLSIQTVEPEIIKPVPQEERKARILVIEDEKDVCELLKAILTNKGHKVETVSNGMEGIKLFEKKKFDLVFTDLGMSRMSGWEVAEKIKCINKNVPVFLITGWNVELKDSEMKENGVDFFIKKPFTMDHILNVIQEGMILRDRFKPIS